jgi:cold shock CspA family protein
LKIQGKISKINTELGYGFVVCPKNGEVFFSTETSFSGSSFESLRVNDSVQVEIVVTERGQFAQALEKDLPKHRSPELTI